MKMYFLAMFPENDLCKAYNETISFWYPCFVTDQCTTAAAVLAADSFKKSI